MPLYLFIILPLAVALIGYLTHAKWYKLLLICFQFFFLAMAIQNFLDVKFNGEKYQVIGGYERGIGIALRADRFGSLLVVLCVFLFTCLIVYNYHKKYMTHLFMFLFLALQGLVNGLFLSNDLFNIYVTVEVSTIVVSILIIFKKDSKSIYDGILYFLTNLGSMTLFFLGIGFVYRVFGTVDLTLIKERMHLVEDINTLIIPYVLMMTAVSLKSAVMPLFSWLPKAHGTASAPSIISATLSGLYVKGGIYLFIRVSDLFADVFDIRMLFMFLGFTTAIAGFVFALSQTDIKLVLAYHTISQVGLILFGLSIDSVYSYHGAVYHIFNHAVFKTTLFLTAGIIIDQYGTRNLKEVRGVFKRMPWVAIAMVIAIFGITGAPLFNGSFSKYMIQKGAGHSLTYDIAFAIINLGTILSFVKYSSMLWGGHEERHKIRWNQKLAVLVLSLICFLGGIMGPTFMAYMFDIHIKIEWADYLDKLLIYGAQLAFGIIFYRFLYHRISLFKTIREIELSLNQIVGSMIVFLTIFIGFMVFTY